MPDETLQSISTPSQTSWVPLRGRAARLRAALRLGGLADEAELFGLVDGCGDLIFYGVLSRETPIVDPDMLLLAFQAETDHGFWRDILEDSRISLHPLPGSGVNDNRAGDLCAMLDLQLLGEGHPDKRTGEVELMVGALIDRAEDQVAGMPDGLSQENAADDVVSLPSGGNADIASS